MGPGSRLLTVTTTIGACNLPPRLSAVETDTAVRLTVRITSRVQPGAMCADAARLVGVETSLHRPLGSRVPVDASTGRGLQRAAVPGRAPSARPPGTGRAPSTRPPGTGRAPSAR